MKITALVLLPILICLGGCTRALPGGAEPRQSPAPSISKEIPPAGGYKLDQGERQFSCEILASLDPGTKGVAVSPASLHQCLLLAALGAEGETLRAFSQVLHLPANQQESIDSLKMRDQPPGVDSANAIYVKKGFQLLPAYRDKVVKDAGAQLEEVDFSRPQAVIDQVNGWVAQKTHDRIPQILHQLDPTSVMILVNAIYLKVNWLHPFMSEATAPEPFFTGKEKLMKPAMRQTEEMRFFKGDTWKMVELPYEGGRLAFDCLLPDQTEGWREVRNTLTRTSLETALRGMSSQLVELHLPSFQQRSSLPLNANLQALGLGQAFSRDANFEAISTVKPLFVSTVVQECFVKVDEKGTEAAAATAVVMAAGCAIEPSPPKIIPFIVDHPFLYFIRDLEKGNILFCGLVLEPESVKS